MSPADSTRCLRGFLLFSQNNYYFSVIVTKLSEGVDKEQGGGVR